MSKRVDSASKPIRASASRIYQAFATRTAMETWLPPQRMTGRGASWGLGAKYSQGLGANRLLYGSLPGVLTLSPRVGKRGGVNLY